MLAYPLLYSIYRAKLFDLNRWTSTILCELYTLALANVNTVYKDSSICGASMIRLVLASANTYYTLAKANVSVVKLINIKIYVDK